MSNSILDLAALRQLAKERTRPANEALESEAAVAVIGEARREAISRALRAVAPQASSAFAEALRGIETADVAREDPVQLVEKLIAEIDIDDNVRETVTAELAGDGALAERLKAPADVAAGVIADIPEVQPEIDRSVVAELTAIAGLSDAASEAVLGRASSLEEIGDQRIATLAIDGVLKEGEAQRIGLVAGIAQFVGGETEVVDRVVNSDFSSLGGPVKTLTDILRIETEELATTLDSKLMESDPDAAIANADSVRIRVEERFPATGMNVRLVPADDKRMQTSFQVAGGILRDQPEVLTSPAGVKLSDDEAAAITDIRAVVNAFPGMGLDKLAVSGGAPQTIVKTIGERVGIFDRFIKQNDEDSLYGLDFTPGSKDLAGLNFEGIKEPDQAAVIEVVKARARTLNLGGTVRVATQLMQAGYHSSFSYADLQPRELALLADLTETEADIAISTARDTRLTVTNFVGTLADELRWDAQNWVWAAHFVEDVSDGLKRLPGYEELFGSQSYCDCAHCDSILSPAAYFVDLMNFIDENVTQHEFTGTTEDHALKLQVRRPDLWTLPLTCDNTHDLVPTLQIVNEILETAIAVRENAGIDTANRPAVLSSVYDDVLPQATRSFVTPFALGVATADRYLTDFDTDRVEILDLIRPGVDAESRNAAALGLSVSAYRMITTPRAQWVFLEALYRMGFPRVGTNVNPFDVQDIIAGMEISRDDFGALIETGFVQGGGNIRIESQKRSAQSVQNDIERVLGMSQGGLDRVHRFWRLAQAIGWDPATLDLVLMRSGGALNHGPIAGAVAVKRMSETLGLDVDQVLSLGGQIPTVAIGNDEDSLMDRLFNRNSAAADAVPFPSPAIRFVHPGLRDDASLPEPGPNAGAYISQRLRVALAISDADLLDLIVMLAPALGIDPEAPLEQDRGFLLTADALSLLYRHAVLADVLGLDADELGLAIRIATGTGAISTPDHVRMLLELTDQLDGTPYDLAAAGGLMGLLADPVADGIFIDGDVVADTVIAGIADGERAIFAPTVFAFLDGVSEAQSRAIVEANMGLFDPAERDMLTLDLATALSPAIAAPVGGFPAGIVEADLQAVLDGYNLRTILPDELSAALDVDADKLIALAALAGVNLATQPVITAAAGGDPAPLRTAVRSLSRPLAALADPALTATRVAFIDTNRGLFELVNPVAAYARRTVFALAAYVEALDADIETLGHAAAVDAVLLAHVPATGFSAADTDELAQATGGEPASIRIFEAGATLPALATLALDRLRRVVTFATDRQLNADAMALLASDDPAALGEAGESLKTALRQRLGDEAAFESAIEGHDDWLRGRQRNALTDYIIRDSNDRFENRGDLYNYYLIDPDMEGCARTSRVVSAIGSLQTYVHRVRLNLEQDRRAPDAANHVHISPSRIPAGEWEWRKNYRVWEANRKVFLWPENYMQPELRDNKTPLFEQLEKTLLQQDITEQTVLDAYASYLRGFEEVAHLRIAGAFHEHVWSQARDVLHVFGCTADDPPNYYYWTIENLIFSNFRSDRRVSYSARRKIDVAISARDVSPILYNNRLHLFWLEKSTAPWNEVEGGENVFKGYRHTLSVKFSFLRLDGSWTPPQMIDITEHDGVGGDMRQGGLVREALDDRGTGSSDVFPEYADRREWHWEYQEGYALRAPAWQKVYPGLVDGELVLSIGAKLFPYRVDMFERKAYRVGGSGLPIYTRWGGPRSAMHVRGPANLRRLYNQVVHRPNTYWPAPRGGRQDYVVSEEVLRRNIRGWGLDYDDVDWYLDLFNLDSSELGASVARVNDPDAHLVAPMTDSVFPELLVQKGSDISLFSYSFSSGRPYRARRLGTTVLTDLGRALFYGGVDGLLDRQTQQDLGEKSHLVTSLNMRTRIVGPVNRLDYTGPLGVYFRELFMHIPALLASHQNARGDYAAAQGWYATIFDPTAKFDSGVDLGSLSDSARLQAERDRVWQYAEFQGMSPPTLRDTLTDEDAQAAYRKDPFNPYAIARLRLSAFQKNIVMRYVDNLLDWADSLFRQFTRESVDEAHILYDLARQILGPRPADAGDCGEGVVRPRSYEKIKPNMEAGQDFLIEAESVFWSRATRHRFVASEAVFSPSREYVGVERTDVLTAEVKGRVESKFASELRFDQARVAGASEKVDRTARGSTELMFGDDKTVSTFPDRPSADPAPEEVPAHVAARQRYDVAYKGDGLPGRQIGWQKSPRVASERAFGRVTGTENQNWRVWGAARPDAFTWGIVRQIGPVFCIPRNKDLLALWDRVEDRLYKIHNCRNIDGDRVDLALFAPEIDPNALVRARAAGLSLSDIFSATAGNLPPYRFSYLVAKARDYTGLVQSFGSKLQGAIERRDGEELAKLRLTQAINMQNLVTKVRENEVKIAEASLEEANRRKTALEARKSYYEGRLRDDLLPWERAEQVLTHSSGASKILAALMSGTAGILHLIPQLGSPFAMKYGGQELGDSGDRWAKVFSDTANLLDIMAKSASLEAKYANRRKGWQHQIKLEDHELKQHEKRITAAELRLEIAQKALDNHEKAIEDQEELLDFYETKFSGEQLYTWMASTMQTIYRKAFNAALSMARLAEQAYRFERPDDSAILLDLTYWEPGQAGLLSGEKLAVDLVAMEKRFIETNYRVLEITQPFSMQEIDPGALMALREEGECAFTVPEYAFDLLYPGHYRRRIRSVRLSIACVTGPYVNVPATLRLTGSKMRVDPTLDGAAGLTDSVLRHTVQIATSTAQNDAGVFDFSFADPRYMPFEGAGAVESTWSVTLPKAFRPFDYDTINDVIVHISYSAQSDGVLRDRVEADNAALEGALTRVLENTPLPRAHSFRQEFGMAFHQLSSGPTGVDTVVSLDERALPVPLRGRSVQIDRALLLIRTGDGVAATGTQMRINGETLTGFAATPEFPGYVVTTATAAFATGLTGDHAVAVLNAGDLAPAPGDPGTFAEGAVEDIVLYFDLLLD